MLDPIKEIITEFLIDLDERSKRGFVKQAIGETVYDTQTGNQGAYCVLKDLQQRIYEIEDQKV